MPTGDRCLVDTGKASVEVVCGAPNVRAGMLGVFAPVGAVIPRTGMVLKASTIRGVPSQGMLCSGYEMKSRTTAKASSNFPRGSRPVLPTPRRWVSTIP